MGRGTRGETDIQIPEILCSVVCRIRAIRDAEPLQVSAPPRPCARLLLGGWKPLSAVSRRPWPPCGWSGAGSGGSMLAGCPGPRRLAAALRQAAVHHSCGPSYAFGSGQGLRPACRPPRYLRPGPGAWRLLARARRCRGLREGRTNPWVLTEVPV